MRTVCVRQECAAAAAAAAIAPMACSSDHGGKLRACERCRASVVLLSSFSLVCTCVLSVLLMPLGLVVFFFFLNDIIKIK